MESSYEKIGRVIHFYSRAGVATVELTLDVRKGDKIVVRGTTTEIEQTVDSMESDHTQLATAQAGQTIGIKVVGRVRENDVVYRKRTA